MKTDLPLASILVSSITGLMFAVGWWFVVVALCQNSRGTEQFSFFHILFPLLTTGAIALLTTVSRNAIISSNDLFSDNSTAGRMLLFSYIGIVLGGFVASLTFFCVSHQGTAMAKNALMLPIGTGMIAFSGLIIKFVRPTSSDDRF